MAKKIVSIKVFHAQIRRISCEHCREPFSFVDGGTLTGDAVGGGVFGADDDDLRRLAFRKVARMLEQRGRREQRGEGRCPHCGALQAWMVKNARRGSMERFALWGLVPGGLATILLFNLLPSEELAFVIGLALTVLLAGAGAAFGYLRAKGRGERAGENDPRVRTDEQLRDWMERCLQRNHDPALQWWLDCGAKPPQRSMHFSLGVLDLAEPSSGVPEPLSTEGRIKVLDRMDG